MPYSGIDVRQVLVNPETGDYINVSNIEPTTIEYVSQQDPLVIADPLGITNTNETNETLQDVYLESFSNTTIINPKLTEYNGINPLNGLDKSVWIQIQALPIERLTNNIRADVAYSTDGSKPDPKNRPLVEPSKSKRYMFKFLAPPELLEQLSHDWQPYDSLAGTISQMGTSMFNTALEQLKGVDSSFQAEGKTLGQMFKDFFTKVKNEAGRLAGGSNVSSTTINSVIGWFQKMSTGGHVANYRVDTPLTYKGSERRSFSLPLTLINVEEGKNNENVVMPVKLLEMLSSPAYPKQANRNFNSDIILPYLFELKTVPGDLIICDLAVLKQVQPTWKGPWIGGYPSRCELRLDFYEYRPLEQKVFYGYNNSGSVINVKIKAIQEDRWATKASNASLENK